MGTTNRFHELVIEFAILSSYSEIKLMVTLNTLLL